LNSTAAVLDTPTVIPGAVNYRGDEKDRNRQKRKRDDDVVVELAEESFEAGKPSVTAGQAPLDRL